MTDDDEGWLGPASAEALRAEVEALRTVLRELVELKDGPRGEDYKRRKPLAWQAAREAAAHTEETPNG